ncbi:MAG: DUF1667 domain-containing protein [Spirochaetes bacterium]|nr:DUF1667 domain-containing protein [Spirochaetota bacterium]
MDKKEYICIACPIGCHLTLTVKGKDQLIVEGNKCKRGEVYAQEEYFAPKRVVTATCASESVILPRVPVKTTAAIPKDLINELIKEIYQLNLKIPIKRNQIIIKDFQGTKVDVVTTRSINQ